MRDRRTDTLSANSGTSRSEAVNHGRGKAAAHNRGSGRPLAIRASRLASMVLVVLVCAAGQSLPSDIDSMLSPLVRQDGPGLAVLIRANGSTVYERGYGVRDVQSSVRIDAQTDFRLASFTKQFTALAVMLLVQDGKLAYDRKLTDIFPGFPAYGRAITVRHLLTHTSGLPDYEDLMDAAEKRSGLRWSATRQIQDREVLELLERETAGKFAPGTSWSYSNSGYVVLGLMVARVSGEPFGKFLHDRIFGPLAMDGTLLYVKGANEVPNRAYGHARRAALSRKTRVRLPGRREMAGCIPI